MPYNLEELAMQEEQLMCQSCRQRRDDLSP